MCLVLEPGQIQGTKSEKRKILLMVIRCYLVWYRYPYLKLFVSYYYSIQFCGAALIM
jgi:hypothetical protein